MKTKCKRTISGIYLLFLIIGLKTSVNAQPAINLETGIVATGYNEVRIPGDEGTIFSLKAGLTPKTKMFYRLRGDYTIKSRHTISVLYAPLKIKSQGSLSKDIFFEGKEFPEHTDLDATYKFNSYRLTYRYDIVHKPRFEFGLGLTAKIRDAKIAISSPDKKSKKTNVGFVPIINFMLAWQYSQKAGILLEGDALAAPQGRAEDIRLAATYDFSDNLGIQAGYRILEGGADNDEVYNFSLFHYASVGLSYTFINGKESD